MSRLLNLAKRFNSFYFSVLQRGNCTPFIIDGHQVGLIRSDIIKELEKYPDVFIFKQITGTEVVELNPVFRNYDERSANVERVMQDLRAKDVFVTLRGWRDECYDVKTANVPLMKIDRSATCLLGVRNYGVDLNGYVKHPTKGLCLWLQQRSDTKQTWPGKWDSLVGGGLSVGYGIKETIIKEAAEEASVPSNLLENLVSAGCVTFLYDNEKGIYPNTEFEFDLELPVDFEPYNNDGEVKAFELVPANEIVERVLSDDFNLTGSPVVIDFLIRHGIINPENEKDYLQVMELLHVPLENFYDFTSKSII